MVLENSSERNPELLKEAFANMPCIHFDSCDVLICDHIGKTYSGNGLDPNMCVGDDEAMPHIVRIPNSLHVEQIMLSEVYYEETSQNPNIVIESDLEPFPLDKTTLYRMI